MDIQVDEETGDKYLSFSPEQMDEIGWEINDRLKWKVEGEKVVIVNKTHHKRQAKKKGQMGRYDRKYNSK